MYKHTIKTSLSGRDALLALDSQEDKFHKTLIVVDDKNIVRGSITDGDVRRGLINGLNIDDKCELFTNKNFKYVPCPAFNNGTSSGLMNNSMISCSP